MLLAERAGVYFKPVSTLRPFHFVTILRDSFRIEVIKSQSKGMADLGVRTRQANLFLMKTLSTASYYSEEGVAMITGATCVRFGAQAEAEVNNDAWTTYRMMYGHGTLGISEQ